jgi:hypothetical protein
MSRHRTRPIRLAVAGAAVVSLIVGACGGDDGGGPGGGSPSGGSPIGDTELPAEARAALDELGIDPDDLGNLENLEDLDLENFDPENFDPSDLDEMMEGLDEFISSMGGGDGGGTVTVDGVTYTVDADLCMSFGDELAIDGPAVGSDGSDAWVEANYGITRREDLVDFMDENQLSFLFPDGVDELVDMNVSVYVGQTSRFDFVEDQPAWSAYGGDAFDMGLELDWEFTGNSLRGSGEATDDNYVALDFGESVPIQFELGCN